MCLGSEVSSAAGARWSDPPPTSHACCWLQVQHAWRQLHEWRLRACNQHCATPFFVPHQALMKAGRVLSELPGQRQRVQLRQRGRFGSGVVRATRARRELFGARDHSHRRHVHVTLRADGEELRCVTTSCGSSSTCRAHMMFSWSTAPAAGVHLTTRLRFCRCALARGWSPY